MLGLLMDTCAIALIIALLSGDDQVEWLKCGLVALGMSIVTAVCLAAGMAAGGLIAFYLSIVIAAALAGVIAWLTIGLTFERSMIVGAAFAVWKVVSGLALNALMS